MAFEIKKGEPIPQGRASGVASTMRKLSVGDSFVITDIKENTRKGLYSTAKHVGIKIVTRKLGGDLRVWRVQSKPKKGESKEEILARWDKERKEEAVQKVIETETAKQIDASAPEPDSDWIEMPKTYENGEILYWHRRLKGKPVCYKRESDLGV